MNVVLKKKNYGWNGNKISEVRRYDNNRRNLGFFKFSKSMQNRKKKEFSVQILSEFGDKQWRMYIRHQP